jgi:hypothetical protein
MPLSIKDPTGYKLVYEVWQKVDGTWVEVPTVHYKIGGTWKLVHSKVTPFIFNQTISVNTYGYNMREAAVLAGWNTTDPLIATITINVGVVVGGESDQNFGFSSGLTFPQASKLTIINNGTIAGMGGKGADSGKIGQFTAAGDGNKGGTALFVNLPTTLINNGSILAAGGGGGGGEGLAGLDYGFLLRWGAGGGGRGANTSLGGVSETTPNPLGVSQQVYLVLATGGTLVSSGVCSSNEGDGSEFGEDYSGFGGNGGLIASSGLDGGSIATSELSSRRIFARGKGGAAGKAIVGKSFITYEVTGTITGAQE